MAKYERSRDLMYKIFKIATLFKAINCGEEIIIQMMKLNIALIATLLSIQVHGFYPFNDPNEFGS